MHQPSVVTNFVMYNGNAYHRALYCALGDRYIAERGDVESAQRNLAVNRGRLLHIHWEEHLLRSAKSSREARALVELVCVQMETYRRTGGRIVWSIHNLMPHELEHPSIFLAFRQRLGQLVDRIVVHTPEAASVLEEQGIRAPLKTYFLPHPSYSGIYPQVEDGEIDKTGADKEKILLVFGLIRRYKAVHRLVEKLSDSLAEEMKCKLEIVGRGIPGDNYIAELREMVAGRKHVIIREEHVPDEGIGRLFGRATCTVLPYERLLTSGVAMLALTYGSLLVGPRVRPLQEVLPSEAHRFLFTPEDDVDMVRAIGEACCQTAEEVAPIREKMRSRADYLRPHRISLQLGDLYDSMTMAAV